MAKKDQSSDINADLTAGDPQNEIKQETTNPADILIGHETFASSKGLPWYAKIRLKSHVEQNGLIEKTFAEWEEILNKL